MELTPGEKDVAAITWKRDHSDNVKVSPRLLLCWFCAGCLAFALDDYLQPRIRGLGEHQWVNFVAEHWQKLAETGCMITFIGVLAASRRGLLKPGIYALLGVAIVGQLTKYGFGRVRPHWTGDLTVFHGPLGLWGDGHRVPVDSLPSGHTAVAFAMAQVLAARWPRVKWLWFVLASGVAVSRTLVDVHFPSDVIFGGLLGFVVEQWALKMGQGVFQVVVREEPQ